jgi:UDP-N-acetylglucosamine acyltransferase
MKLGKNVEIGSYCVIDDDVIIGDNTVIKSYVELRKGTVIGKDCYIDSRVSSSGNCKIGDNVTLRYDTIIARGVEIGDRTYVCPRVMTNNLNENQNGIGGAKIGKDCFIGTNVVLQHGITIADGTTIGSMSFANKDIIDSGVYIGIPAKKIR